MQGSRIKQDEIDLIDILISLWEGKWLLVITTFLLVTLCVSYISLKEPTFKAELEFYPIASSDIASYTAVNSIIDPRSDIFSADLPDQSERSDIAATIFDIDEEALSKAFVSEFRIGEAVELAVLSSAYMAEDFNTKTKRDRRLISLLGNLSIETPDFENGTAGKISFNGSDEKDASMLMLSIVKAVNDKTRDSIIDEIYIKAEGIQSFLDAKIQALETQRRLILSRYSREVNLRKLNLKENAEIARELNLAKPVSGVIYGNGAMLSNRALGDNLGQYFLRGYEAIDKEIDILDKRGENIEFAPGIFDIDDQIETLNNTKPLKSVRAAIKFSPLAEGRVFTAIEYDPRLVVFTFDNNPYLYLVLSAVAGVFIGIAIVLVRKGIESRRTF